LENNALELTKSANERGRNEDEGKSRQR